MGEPKRVKPIVAQPTTITAVLTPGDSPSLLDKATLQPLGLRYTLEVAIPVDALTSIDE